MHTKVTAAAELCSLHCSLWSSVLYCARQSLPYIAMVLLRLPTKRRMRECVLADAGHYSHSRAGLEGLRTNYLRWYLPSSDCSLFQPVYQHAQSCVGAQYQLPVGL